ncbi:hypothetical protein A3D42_02715 [Candidatus Nomurabacteria bacterium RIFCSPHIGHO2_02_FULL_41_18]|uniref:Uncharacterized protein n=1 Tax=Candidatus Nomurabacteria bacterium RIFCSPHIGHO2_02_FULL_41_18 TaxID=1801754 RepID=A0A1F6W6Z3_9BACT|nr:MAG: hypothetical protein A2737_02780 [Candidatus Nomurabacteria bacterium RIFCSPHIGHO2_01_FULL_41_71]OGI77700.1 MAG: hypothetical protein A3D42_02715 [Candidatus Nomurabacteria bacterium RIFCSPHIGHO2_02_FULL_41_18]OGI89972.1 MAG: hypothetical protein A3B01_01895 [Candidatus Nomurabacteria bacterium RIFCSPLOWO2_01_FULL_41_52b]OGJ00484.1 MAG: hypothetical protein A3I90_00485 [Candidatus Nomurabacteria bacterium RIFCSPLOWO2_02_FULL_41_9]
MVILLSSFFISLISLTIIFGRKLIAIREQEEKIVEQEHAETDIPYMAEIKEIIIRKIKKYGYLGIETIIRIYFRSLNFLKARYEEFKKKIEGKNNVENKFSDRKTNGFLKMVSDYKHKIRQIKHKVKEEEKKP